MATRNISDCDKKLQDAWQYAQSQFRFKYPNKPQPIITCAHRSNDEQNALYALGRTVAGKIVTNAKGGQSKHNSLPSKAFDIAFKDSKGKISWDLDLFTKFADIIKPKGIKWGGDWKFKDYPHFEI